MAAIIEALGLISSITGIHSWITSSQDKRDLEQNFRRTRAGVHVLSNRLEAIEQRIDSVSHDVGRISSSLQSYIGLASPTIIDPLRAQEFVRTLSKYIASNILPLSRLSSSDRHSHYRIQPGTVPMMWNQADGISVIGMVPSGFLKDYFGIELIFSQQDKSALIREAIASQSQSLRIATPSQALLDYQSSRRTTEIRSKFNDDDVPSYDYDNAPISNVDPWRSYRWTGKSHIFMPRS